MVGHKSIGKQRSGHNGVQACLAGSGNTHVAQTHLANVQQSGCFRVGLKRYTFTPFTAGRVSDVKPWQPQNSCTAAQTAPSQIWFGNSSLECGVSTLNPKP